MKGKDIFFLSLLGLILILILVASPEKGTRAGVLFQATITSLPTWQFKADNSTPPAAVTPVLNAGTPVYDGDWTWRTWYNYTYEITQITAEPGNYVYRYSDCNATNSGCTIMNKEMLADWQAGEKLSSGVVEARLAVDPAFNYIGSEATVLDAFWHKLAGDKPDSIAGLDGPWRLIMCPESVVAWMSDLCPSSDDACTVKLESGVFGSKQLSGPLWTDCDNSEYHTVRVEWDTPTGEAGYLNLYLDGNPTPVVALDGTVSKAYPFNEKYNAIRAGLTDLHYIWDATWAVNFDYVYAFGGVPEPPICAPPIIPASPATATPAPATCLQVTEICANPILDDHWPDGVVDEGDRAVELYNCGSVPFDASNYYLCTEKCYWLGDIIEVGEYKALYQKVEEVSLLPEGGRIELWVMSEDQTVMVDGLQYGSQTADYCWTLTETAWEEQRWARPENPES